MAALIVILVMAALYALDWLITVGLCWVVCWCFGLTFSWAIATGIWIVIIMVETIFRGNKS